MNKRQLLNDWAQRVATASTGGLLGNPINVTFIQTVSGPRAGALHVLAGLDAARLVSALSKQNNALLRQMVPWDFTGDTAAYMYGRFVRLEAGWSDNLADNDIPLSRIAQTPHYPPTGGKWICGLDEGGRVVIPSVNLAQTPHWLFSGATGSGKTVALRSTAVQLAADKANRLILVDGKLGASFRHPNRDLFRLRRQVGPVATTAEQWRGALGWAVQVMQQRYEEGYDDRLIILVDEVQEVVQDPVAAEAFRILVVMGRDAAVHIVSATQHPVVDALGGPTVVRNLGGRLALRVSDAVASRVALGDSTLPAHCLLGKGDCYAKTPEVAYRVQVAYVTEDDLAQVSGDEFAVPTWPYITAEDLGMEHKRRGRRSPWPRATEIGAALVAAEEDQGRGLFQDAVEDASGRRPGSGRADRILQLGRDTYRWLEEQGWGLSPGGVNASKALPASPKFPHTPHDRPDLAFMWL